MLEAIATKLMEKGLVNSQWRADTQKQGELVKLYREYYDGYHRLQLTKEMKNMLNISDDRLDRYNCNYCEMVIASMADRLTVEQFDVTGAIASDKNDSDPAQDWVNALMDYNRFDALQIDVRVAALRDGETFVMSQYDDQSQQIELAHELAYDGEVGTIVIYTRGYEEIAAAVKIWFDVKPTSQEILENETSDNTLYMRANIYYPDYTEKYYSTDQRSMTLITDPEVTVRQNKTPGVPITCFSNKDGVSELVNIIPLQDSLNSFLVDLVMSAQLTAFSVFFAVGVDVPQGITPGMVIRKNIVDKDGFHVIPSDADEAAKFASVLGASRLERIQGGDLSQVISAIDMVIGQISVISSTPIPSKMGGDSQSGEALKQRDVRLLGKLNRAQVQMGNAWEDVILLANNQQTLFGSKTAPAIVTINTRWKSAEIRNNADILLAAKQLHEWGFTRAALRTLSQSSLVSFTDAEIDKMMAEQAADVANKMISAAGNMPGFSNAFVPTNQPAPLLN
jgi:hypothetical protein